MIAKMSTARYFCLFRSEEGATAVEAAIVLSTFLVITLGLVEFAMAYWNYSTMLLAVDEGGRSAMVYNPVSYPNGPPTPPAPCPAQTQAPGCPSLTAGALENCAVAQAQTVLTNYQAPAAVAVSARQVLGATPTMTVCASYSFGFIAPGLLPYGPIALKRQVTVPLD
jgi:Flp pilus assembly protein TadG